MSGMHRKRRGNVSIQGRRSQPGLAAPNSGVAIRPLGYCAVWLYGLFLPRLAWRILCRMDHEIGGVMEDRECRYSVRHDGPWIVVTWHDFNPFGVCGTFELDPQNEEIINCVY